LTYPLYTIFLVGFESGGRVEEKGLGHQHKRLNKYLHVGNVLKKLFLKICTTNSLGNNVYIKDSNVTRTKCPIGKIHIQCLKKWKF
jgi:hypothetical protein